MSTALLRQLTGTGFRENANYLDEKVTELKLAPKDLYQKEGFETLDYMMAKRIGQIAEEKILPALEENQEKFESLSTAEKRLVIRKNYTKARKEAREELYETNPLFRLMVKFNDLGPDKRKLLNEKKLREKGKTVTQMFEEAKDLPVAGNDRHVAEFPPGTKYMDLRDYQVKVKQ